MRTLLTVRGAALLATALLTGCASTHVLIRPHAVGAPTLSTPQPVIQASLTPPVLDTPIPSAAPSPAPSSPQPPSRPRPHLTRRPAPPLRVTATRPAVEPVVRPPAAAAPLREPSANWSGYVASGSFGEVAATWTEPVVRCTAANSTLALWVGLGGDGSLPLYQAGSGVICRDGAPTHILWYELLTETAQPPQIIVRTISPGDVVSAEVGLADPSGGGVVRLADRTAGYEDTVGFTPEAATLGSAEWIAEATTVPGGQITPLADFGTAAFTGCTADQGSVELSTWPAGRLTALLLHDVNGGSAAPGAVTSGDGFSVSYGR